MICYPFYDDNPLQFEFDNRCVKLKDKSRSDALLEGGTFDGLYLMPIEIKKKGVEVLSMERGLLELWHCRLGHLHPRAISI